MPDTTRRRAVVAVIAGVLLSTTAACTSAPEPAGSADATASTEAATASPGANRVVIDIRLTGGSVEPNGAKIDVRRGQTVVLNVTSDHDDEVHVHGFDIEIPVTAGTPVSKQFVADQPGGVEIESHRPAKIIAIMNVR